MPICTSLRYLFLIYSVIAGHGKTDFSFVHIISRKKGGAVLWQI